MGMSLRYHGIQQTTWYDVIQVGLQMGSALQIQMAIWFQYEKAVTTAVKLEAKG